MNQERTQILKMLEAGQIDAEEAATLLSELDSQAPVAQIKAQPAPLVQTEGQAIAWEKFWIYPLIAGAAVLGVGLLCGGLAFAAESAWAWLFFGMLPMFLGFTIILLAVWSRRARWLHLRINENGRRKMALSLPLPLTLTAWALKIAQPFAPQLKETGVDDLLIALRDGASREEPFYIDVEDGQDGEHVELYIG